jgi:hypothetical protein
MSPEKLKTKIMDDMFERLTASERTKDRTAEITS